MSGSDRANAPSIGAGAQRCSRSSDHERHEQRRAEGVDRPLRPICGSGCCEAPRVVVALRQELAEAEVLGVVDDRVGNGVEARNRARAAVGGATTPSAPRAAGRRSRQCAAVIRDVHAREVADRPLGEGLQKLLYSQRKAAQSRSRRVMTFRTGPRRRHALPRVPRRAGSPSPGSRCSGPRSRPRPVPSRRRSRPRAARGRSSARRTRAASPSASARATSARVSASVESATMTSPSGALRSSASRQSSRYGRPLTEATTTESGGVIGPRIVVEMPARLRVGPDDVEREDGSAARRPARAR